MRSTNEQFNEIMNRAEILKKKTAVRKRLYVYSAVVCCCVLLLVVSAVFMPQLSADTESNILPQYGSIVLSTSVMGYVIVGFFALILGICGTMLCISWKELNCGEHEKNEL